jgi:hypothetical protein
LIVVAVELAFGPKGGKKGGTLLRPVAIAVAVAVPPSIAVEVAVALADPVITKPTPLKMLPPVA